jgi:hypothetical protein
MLLPLGSPLPDDAVSAVRGESGLLGGLSVPLIWGVAVPPDDYDHWAPELEEGAAAEDPTNGGQGSESAVEARSGWGKWGDWGGDAEPRFEVRRASTFVPHSPAAG